MSWLTNKIDQWAIGNQQKELSDFVARLRSMDSAEIGPLVAVVTDFKNRLEASGHVVSDPILYYAQKPQFPLTLGGSIKDLQKLGKTHEAAGLMVWLHTMRAGARLELRQLGRDLWRELARGMPYAEDATGVVGSVLGRPVNLTGLYEFPKGMSPDPLG